MADSHPYPDVSQDNHQDDFEATKPGEEVSSVSGRTEDRDHCYHNEGYPAYHIGQVINNAVVHASLHWKYIPQSDSSRK